MGGRFWHPVAALVTVLWAVSAHADEFERAPIHYRTAPADNRVARLDHQLRTGKAALNFDPTRGFLPALLKALDVPTSSQTLVFSKTSLQRERIAPKTPRALYFSDDVYVGYCQQGEVLEISAVDPNLGTVFYTLDQAPGAPKLTRQNDTCLQCHDSTQARGVPGHLVRSVFADRTGTPILSFGSFRVDATTPLAQRWGGWYVTGTHGQQKHLGNSVVKRETAPEQFENAAGQNVTDLRSRLDTAPYLTPHSDLIALMVLEHQTAMHNLITKASFQARLALHEEAELNRELGRSDDYRSETTWRRLKGVGEPLLRGLLFSKETPLTDKLCGTSTFASDFPRAGPRDPRGRSLRDLDLERRLFRYPCSYLIYSESFAALPAPMKDYVYMRLREILDGRDYSRDFDHLSAEDRQAISEVLCNTKSDVAQAWKLSGAGSQ